MAGVADLGDPVLKEQIVSLKAIRDQAQADAGQQAITPQMGPEVRQDGA